MKNPVIVITNSITTGIEFLRQKVQDYKLLFKLRLSMLVVFSADIAYLLGTSGYINWEELIALSFGGGMITFASNALNQVLEKDYDKIMKRTSDRPLPAARMSLSEAVLAAGLMAVLGGLVLFLYFNPLTYVLGMLSLISYAFIYTPMKRVSPVSVWIGAVPGALPLLIGWVAATGEIGIGGLFLFSVQFFWQFPHFWAIAWVAHEDYTKAGYYLLPTKEKDGRNKQTALQIVAYALILIPLSIVPYLLGLTGYWGSIVMFLTGIVYTWSAIRLYKECSHKAALRVMFTSFLYVPIVYLTLFADKI